MDDAKKRIGKYLSAEEVKKLYGKKRTYMSVQEMGKIFGLKKTESYRLLHTGSFPTKVIGRKTWINIAGFEKWYANQVKYRKVDGEAPGHELRKRSYSARDIAEMLGISEAYAYSLMKTNAMPVIFVDGWRRVPREAFETWYAGQSRFRKKTDRLRNAEMEETSISMPEMARLLGVARGVVYSILKNEKYQDVLQVIVVAERKRITKESFRKFLSMQTHYRLQEPPEEKAPVCKKLGLGKSDESEGEECAGFKNAEDSSHAKSDTGSTKPDPEAKDLPRYISRAEAARMAQVSETWICKLAAEGYFSERKVGSGIRISREEFINWLRHRERDESARQITSVRFCVKQCQSGNRRAVVPL